MKVVLVGPAEQDGRSGPVWDQVRAVMQALGPQDELVHSTHGVGRMVDSIARRAKGQERRRLPRISVQVPEIGRFERQEAFRRNAAQLLHVQAPHVLVWTGDPDDEEVAPMLALAGAYPAIVLQSADEFIGAHAR